MSKSILVIIDAGHGGLDWEGTYVTPGKRSPSALFPKIYEGLVNRVQSNLLNYRLSLEGIRSHIIAPENNDVGINTRVQRINAIVKNERSKGNDCFGVCIHANYAGTELSPIKEAEGWEILTGAGETNSDKIAKIFVEEVKKSKLFKLRLGTDGGDKDRDDLGILKYSDCPFVLCEDGFMSNYNDNTLDGGEYHKLQDPNFNVECVEYKVAAIKRIIKEFYKL